MTQASSPKKPPAYMASALPGSVVNSHFGLSLPADKFVLVTMNVPALTASAEFQAYFEHDLWAEVQQLVIVDRLAVMHCMLDLHASGVARLLADSVETGLTLVFTNSAGTLDRCLTVKMSKRNGDNAHAIARHFAAFKPFVLQADLYVASIAVVGFRGPGTLADHGSALADCDVHFRPVIGPEHIEHIGDSSLDDLIEQGRNMPTLKDFPFGDSIAMVSIADLARAAGKMES